MPTSLDRRVWLANRFQAAVDLMIATDQLNTAIFAGIAREADVEHVRAAVRKWESYREPR